MTTSKIAEQINRPRRNFIGAAAITAAAAQFGLIGEADAQPAKTKLPEIKPGTHTSFGPLPAKALTRRTAASDPVVTALGLLEPIQ